MASSRDVISFRLSYAEFKALSDADVAAALDDADVWLDWRMWSLNDFPTARYLWAAHNLNILMVLLANQEAMGDKMGFTNQTMASVGFGERRIAFKQLRSDIAQKNPYSTGPDQLLAETTYGQLFLALRSRNIMPIMSI